MALCWESADTMENWEYLDIHLSRRLTLKTNPESPPKIKDEQSVFPKDSKDFNCTTK